MKRPSFPPQPSGEGDSWESLAEDLFGIDVGRTPESGEIVPPEELEEETEEQPRESAAAEESAPDDQPDAEVEAEPKPGPDEVEPVAEDESLRRDSDEPLEPPADEGDAQSAAAVRDVAPDQAAPGRDDTYWDALEDLHGEETERREPATTSPASGVSRRETADRTYRPEPRVPDEDADDPDFGAGILDDLQEPVPPSRETEEPETAETAESTDQGETVRAESSAESGEGKKRKRRPRRRRRRSRSKERPREGEGINGAAEPRRTESGDTQDKSEAAPAEKPSSPSQRRGGRRGAAATTGANEFAETPSQGDDRDWDIEADDDESSETSSQTAKSSYRKVPTWEEAISYLLKRDPSGGRDEESESSSGKSRGDRSKRSGRKGRRRRR